jgi:hypothetical protein
MVDLPAPIIPTSTIDRVPSAAVISASWDVLAVAGEAASDIENSVAAGIAAFRATYTTPADTVARDSCNRRGNMLVVSLAIPDDFNGYFAA